MSLRASALSVTEPTALAPSGRFFNHPLSAVPIFRLLTSLLLALCLLFSSGCRRAYDIGDHVLVEWEGATYPGVIIDIPGPGKVKIHYDGYDEMWDEVVPRSRLKGRIEEGQEVPSPEAPAKVRRTAIEASKTNRFKMGDRVKVDWNGHYYPAVISGIVGPERYRIHYLSYGSEWDENVGRERIRGQ